MSSAAWEAPNANTMAVFRERLWESHALTQHLGSVYALLAHAPRAAQDFLDLHALDPRQRIERVIATCAMALQDRQQLAATLKRIVPALAQEKLLRSGFDPSQASYMLSTVRKVEATTQSHDQIS